LGEAKTLARRLDDGVRLGHVLARMTNVLRITGDLDGAIATGQQALTLAAQLGERALQMQASYHLGQAYYSIGDFGRRPSWRQNVEVADRTSDRPSIDVRLQSRAFLAALGKLGHC
jgi:hypothetical protein